MRTAFHSWLAAVDHAVLDLCGQVTRATRGAGLAALLGDLRMAESVLGSMADITGSANEVSERAAALMARQQPVAQDLRRLLGAQRNAASLEQMGLVASSLAKLTRRRYPRPVLPTEVHGVVADMSSLADRLMLLTGDILRDSRVAHPNLILSMAEQMEHLHREMLTIVRSTAWPHDVATAVDMSLISRDLVRLTEHAVEIAGVVTYVDTGSAHQHGP